MTLFPKKRPWIVLVILYAVIIGGWVTFIVLAKKRDTRRLTPDQATEFYEQHKKQQTPPETTNP